ncbi:TetR/AcrR family transcriptional regulator C-terminal domain-containing protein [Kitasatospora sp. NPDC096077]|uniref:TetR/AcrR family transcriptional regulator n=1 Tax=Kitasatospora sp. NPDC096077 TaxID=3155544 RepID=UPI0033230E30
MASTDPATAGRTGGRRARGALTADLIVTAALEITRQDGLEALSMPRLARHLGCGVMTIYGHLDGRDQLLGLLCSRVLGGLEAERADGIGGREALTRFALALHGRMLQHPALAHLLTQRKLWSPEVADLVEWVLAELTVDGRTLEQAVTAYRLVLTHTLGAVLYELPRTGADQRAEYAAWWRHTLADLPADDYPLLHAAGDHLGRAPADSRFRTGLTALLDGLGTP